MALESLLLRLEFMRAALVSKYSKTWDQVVRDLKSSDSVKGTLRVERL